MNYEIGEIVLVKKSKPLTTRCLIWDEELMDEWDGKPCKIVRKSGRGYNLSPIGFKPENGHFCYWISAWLRKIPKKNQLAYLI